MLTQILPGLRELRSPLVIGWAWILAFVILVGDDIPQAIDSSPFLQQAQIVSSGLGKATLLGVLSFIAYLVGSLTELRISPGLRKGPAATAHAELTDWARERYPKDVWLHAEGGERLIYPGGFRGMDRPGERGESSRAFLLAGRILDTERTSLSTRLLTGQKDVHELYDRSEESAHLRLNLIPPVLALSLSAGLVFFWEGNYFGTVVASALGIAIGSTLFVRGRQKARDADIILVEAIKAQLTTSPSIDAFEEIRQRVHLAPSNMPETEGQPHARSGRDSVR